MRNTRRLLAAVLLLLVAFLLIRTMLYNAPPRGASSAFEPLTVDTSAVASRLSDAIRIPTVSQDIGGTVVDSAAFYALHELLEQQFPRVHNSLAVRKVGALSLLYHWRSTAGPGSPLLLLAHQDVVPAIDSVWTNPPFEGVIDAEFVWGRGSIDDKSSLVSILSAVEQLLSAGHAPSTDVWIAVGHDEEVGSSGAQLIAEVLRGESVRPGLVIDEGGILGHGLMPGLSNPIAVIGLAEKGSANIELSTSSSGGHSSMPPRSTAIGVLSQGILEMESHPLPARIDGATSLMLDAAGPHMSWPNKIVFANRWLFNPLLKRILGASPKTDATIRTTTAATIFSGGTKSNVLPAEAKAVINFRLLPGDTDSTIVEHARRTLADTGIQVRLLPGARNPSPTSSSDSEAYRYLEQTILRSFAYDDLVVAPYLLVGGSDARWYTDLSPAVYRFQPIDIPQEDGLRLHAVDERIPIESLAGMVAFYVRLIEGYGG